MNAEARALVCRSHSLKNTTDLNWNHYVGFMRITNSDRMLSRDELSIRAEIYKYSCVIVETSPRTL